MHNCALSIKATVRQQLTFLLLEPEFVVKISRDYKARKSSSYSQYNIQRIGEILGLYETEREALKTAHRK